MAVNKIADFFRNFRRIPVTFRESLFRFGLPTSSRVRSQVVSGSAFLHIHSTRVHRYSLKPSFTFGLGIIAISAFIILCVSGVALMIYYKPSAVHAYSSIKDIQYVVPGGRFLRNVHRWATNVMIVIVFLHMARVFYTAAYKGSRAFNWVLGLILLVLTLGLSFTGYLLPWDQLAYWAITIGTNIAASTRELTDVLGITGVFDPGGLIKTVLLGSREIGQEALSRFYWLHCILLPIFMMLFMAVHLWRIRKDGGLARPTSISEEELEGIPHDEYADSTFTNAPEKTYGLMCIVKGETPAVGKGPEHTIQAWPIVFLAEVALFMATLSFICVIAYFFDAPLKEFANAEVPENPAKAPWYFLGLQEMVSHSAFMGGMVIPAIVLIGLALIPYLDREEQTIGRWFDNSEGRRVALSSLIYATVVVVGMLIITVRFGWLRSWFPAIPQIVITLINPGSFFVLLFAVWSFFIIGRQNSTRMGAIALFTCFLVAFVILTYFATYHRGPNWRFYWMKSQWPLH